MKAKLGQLPDKHKLMWLMSRSVLEETVQWVLQVEMKGLNSNLKPYKEIKIFSKGSYIGKYKNSTLILSVYNFSFISYVIQKT